MVALLREALKRKGDVNIDVCAILNDTTGKKTLVIWSLISLGNRARFNSFPKPMTGCLMSCAWKEPKCRIGLIVGTGTNACYLEVGFKGKLKFDKQILYSFDLRPEH